MPLKEKPLIERIRRQAARPAGRFVVGIGDDCAVLRLPPGHEALVTTDFSLEGVHFRREWHPPDSVGHRCLARGLSDIAAMGGVPRAAFLSLALPPDLPQSWVDRFLAGLLKLAAQYSIPLAGGDTAQSPGGILADIMVLGSVPQAEAVLRSGARAGDLIYVTGGGLGSSVAALNRLRDGEKLRPRSHMRHFYPDPRIVAGKFLREKKLASAMIDISDGLSTDLGHICDQSKVGAVIFATALPARVGGVLSERGVRATEARVELAFRPASKPSIFDSEPASAGGTKRSIYVEGRSDETGARERSDGSTTRAHARYSFVSGHGFSRAERRHDDNRALAPAALELALHGGEEYELLFTAPPDRRVPKQIAGVPITRIGEIVRGRQMKLVDTNGKAEVLKPAGWEHFG